jgi:hypothetical protein
MHISSAAPQRRHFSALLFVGLLILGGHLAGALVLFPQAPLPVTAIGLGD